MCRAGASEAIAEVEQKVKDFTKEAKVGERKAKEIEDAIYDLNAVNPNKKPEIDTRTPEQLLDIIEAKGTAITEALATLRGARVRPMSSDGGSPLWCCSVQATVSGSSPSSLPRTQALLQRAVELCRGWPRR